ncbi:pyridoxal phosphate-dependent aminotransferase [Pedobacter hartonius]|uniref:Aminotransferase n=1 Tax=Pedobacter hartonius TaxID=425514 RepID=A0A1H4AS42_9SPHI|nr:aminotransferase class I/II-fold pyridoxal phosphate-dependent enzyme [Pedobacter hartonius]SEA38710.1 threonine-phosphate decarboxylase [Pedobacter hartonius]
MFQGHGDDGYLHNKPLTADFSTNVYHGGAPAGLKEYLFAHWDKVMRYPEVLAESLTEKIAGHYGFGSGHILVTSGSTESIYLIAQAFKHKRSTLVIPAFAEYEDACRMHGHEINFIRWEDVELNHLLKGTDLVFICNPNNPTGAVMTELEQLIVQHPHTLFVVDEAFIEFTCSITSLVGATEKYSNLVVMRSMTKAYAVPGLRLGYIVAQPPLIALFRSAKLPWTVNTMALEAGHFIFDHLDSLTLPLQQLLADKADLIRELDNAPLTIYPSHTHFFLAETQVENASRLKRFLLDEFNILIRDAGNFRGLSENFIRIATLSPAKNKLLINALSEWKRT